MSEKKTFGSQVLELSKDTSGGMIDMREIIQANAPDHNKSIEECATHARKQSPCTNKCRDICATKPAMVGDFYIEVLAKHEVIYDKALPNGGVTIFLQCAKQKCPTPFFDQTVYRVTSDTIEFLWVVPDIDTCIRFYEAQDACPPEAMELMTFILSYLNGNLHRVAQKLNGEEIQKGTILTKE
jgi:hypothetical protein